MPWPMAEILSDWNVQAVIRLAVASVLGALIGLEREHHGRAAGLRTQLLVSLGAATAMLVSLYFGEVYGRDGEYAHLAVDPARVAYGVMGGVGFLGAGAIIHYGAGIRGLTTAASLWCSAAIGLASGFGMFAIAVAATALVLFALAVLDSITKLIPERVVRRVTLVVPGTAADSIGRCREALAGAGVRIADMTHDRDFGAGRTTITFAISGPDKRLKQGIAALEQAVPDVARLKVE